MTLGAGGATISAPGAALTFRADDQGVAPIPNALNVFAATPVPIGSASWSLRPFSLTGETIQPYAIEVVPPAPSPPPEPAGLFLLGTGAFATALTIRYRLFSL